MVYTEKEIQDIITCPNCNSIYNDPRIVPCNSTICSSCINRLIDKQRSGFDCPSCKQFHSIPVDGFPKDQTCAKLTERNAYEIHRKQSAEDLKLKLNDLKSKTDKLNMYLEHGVDKIKDYCNLVRAEVQLATESIIEDVNECKNHLFKEIAEYENKCENIFVQKTGYKVDFEKTVEDMHRFKNKWTEYIRNGKLEEETLRNGMSEASKCIEIVQKEYGILKNKLFNNEVVSFERSNKRIDPSFIGEVKHGEGLKQFEIRHKSLSLKEPMHNYKSGSLFALKCLKNGNFCIAYQVNEQSDLDLLTVSRKGKIIHRKNSILEVDKSSSTLNSIKLCTVNNLIYLFIGYYDEYYGSKYKLNKYDEHLCLVKEKNLSHNLITICSYHNELFCLKYSAFDHEILYVYDTNLNVIGSFGQKSKELPYFFSNTITKMEVNEKYFIILDNKIVKLMNRSDGLIEKEFNIASEDFCLFMENRLLKYEPTGKLLTTYDFEGNHTESKVQQVSNDAHLIDCLEEKLVFFDNARFILQFQY